AAFLEAVLAEPRSALDQHIVRIAFKAIGPHRSIVKRTNIRGCKRSGADDPPHPVITAYLRNKSSDRSVLVQGPASNNQTSRRAYSRIFHVDTLRPIQPHRRLAGDHSIAIVKNHARPVGNHGSNVRDRYQILFVPIIMYPAFQDRRQLSLMGGLSQIDLCGGLILSKQAWVAEPKPSYGEHQGHPF